MHQRKTEGTGEQGKVLKGTVQRLTQKFTRSKVKGRGRSSKSPRDIQEVTKFTNFRERAGGVGVGAILSVDKCSRHHCLFVEPSPTQPAQWEPNLCFPLTCLKPSTLPR